jgi:hypothetical protein
VSVGTLELTADKSLYSSKVFRLVILKLLAEVSNSIIALFIHSILGSPEHGAHSIPVQPQPVIDANTIIPNSHFIIKRI